MIGDYNTAHHPIDLARPKPNAKKTGFLPRERDVLTGWLDAGFTDTYRHLYPEKEGAYSWWSTYGDTRARNVGWRIDYVFASTAALPFIQDAFIWPDDKGSDHCPVGVTVDPAIFGEHAPQAVDPSTSMMDQVTLL